MNNRLDFFIERLLFHEKNVKNLALIITLAREDLRAEDKRQDEIEDQALEDAHYGDRYGKGD